MPDKRQGTFTMYWQNHEGFQEKRQFDIKGPVAKRMKQREFAGQLVEELLRQGSTDILITKEEE